MALVSVPMTSVKQVDERARQQEQVRQNAQDVRPVFSDEKETHDREEREQRETRARPEPSLRFVRWFAHRQTPFIIDVHGRAAHARWRGRAPLGIGYFTTTVPVWACILTPAMWAVYSYVPGLSNVTRPSLPR